MIHRNHPAIIEFFQIEIENRLRQSGRNNLTPASG